ncbi:hypothetical protein [Sandarakinorhabdus oryzae]|uniref:hypothetical protein n=1 Tax=Sandarakinorhabdus oryzae TaxID=2675220 RepID=UPI0012E2BB8F|nr:hypothetical protein [Sandarakinorhabdus oryzae]
MTDTSPASRPGWPALIAPAAGAIWAAATLFNPALFNDQDTNWHLATGQLILRSHAIPSVDPFSWPAAGRPWVTHEWLSEVLMALMYQAGGWAGLALLTATTLAVVLTIIAIRAGQSLAPQRALLATIIVAAALAPTTLIRPHMLAFALLTGWTALLIDARRRDGVPPWWSLLLLILWVNMHASWILGFGLAGAFGLEALLLSPDRGRAFRSWLGFGLACLAVTLINPQGLVAWTYPFEVSSMTALHIIGEWRPMDPRRDVLHLASIAIVTFAAARLYRHIGAVRLLLLAGLMWMAVQHIRHLSPFVLVASLVLLDAIRSRPGWAPATPPRARPAVLVAAVVMLASIGARIAIPLNREDNTANPMTALAAVPPAIRALPVINFYDYGGVLILNGIRPYVDGRADMYGDAHMLEYEQVLHGNVAAFARATADRKVGWLLVHPTNRLLPVAEKAGWKRIYGDEWAVVLVRPDLVSAPAS